MQLTAVPLARHQRVVFDNGLLKGRHVALSGLHGGRNHRFVLDCHIVLRDRVGRRTLKLPVRPLGVV